MKSLREKRRAVRWPVRLMARCVVSGGRRAVESSVWVKDVNEKGLRLEWSRELDRPTHSWSREEAGLPFGKGRQVSVNDLFYDEQGAHGLRGRVRWTRPSDDGDQWSVGIQVVPSSVAAFQDFLDVVKNGAPG